MEREATVMWHAWRSGFPVPRIFDCEGTDILMERIEGPSMFEDAIRNPGRSAEHGRTLGELLRKLGEIRAPGWLQGADRCPGNRLLHLDLHPANILIAEDGPRVIDWANASRGASGADVAYTWIILATTGSELMPPNVDVGLLEELLGGFMGAADTDRARKYLPVMAERRCADANTSDEQTARITEFVARETEELPTHS